jgi:hypothetical protein
MLGPNQSAMTIGRQLVTEPALLLAWPIINLPPGSKRMRIRSRGYMVPVCYVKTENSIQAFVPAFVDDEAAIELIPIMNEANYTREFQ